MVPCAARLAECCCPRSTSLPSTNLLLANLMVDFSDPAVIQRNIGANTFSRLTIGDSNADQPCLTTVTLRNLYLIIDGIYLWVCFVAWTSCSHVD